MSDYLAYVQLGGGGSWGRADSIEEAAHRCMLSLKDWKMYFDLEGKEVEVGVYDVEGFDQLLMGDGGVRSAEEPHEQIKMLKTVKVQCEWPEYVELPVWDDDLYEDLPDGGYAQWAVYCSSEDAIKASDIAKKNADRHAYNRETLPDIEFGKIEQTRLKGHKAWKVRVPGF